MIKSIMTLLKISGAILLVTITVSLGYGVFTSILNKIASTAYMHQMYYKEDDLAPYAPDFNHYSNKYPAMLHLRIGKDNGCSAFVIDNNYAVTAGHCLSESPLINYAQNVNSSLKEEIPVRTVGYNMRVDQGVVMGDFSKFNHAPILPNQDLSIPTAGHIFTACGYPESQKHLLCTPVVLLGPENFMIVGSGVLYPGMSGGPVLDPQTGVVIGIAVAVQGSDMKPSKVVVAPLTGLLGNMHLENAPKTGEK